MKTYKESLFIIFCFLLSSCTQKNTFSLAEPHIKSGIARISGKIINFKHEDNNENIILNLSYPNPVTAGMNQVETELNADGSFNFEASLECDVILGSLSSKTEILESKSLLIELSINKTSEIEIVCDEEGNISAKTNNSQGITSYDMLNWRDKYHQMHIDRPKATDNQPIYELSPEKYAHKAINSSLAKRLAKIETDTSLSKGVKTFVLNNFRLFFLNDVLLEYKDAMYWKYKSTNSSEKFDDFVPQEPSFSYYTFLKYFDLNNPQNLYIPEYFMISKKILSNKTFNIPTIGDTPIDIWLKNTKSILSELTGLNSGLFYEMLVAHAYIKQFDEKIKPLSDKQKSNLKKYSFENQDIVRILLARNEKVQILAKNKCPVIVNETPEVSKEKLMDTIISGHKSRVVVVDFWATWCQPCLVNMEQYRDIKNSFSEKDVKFIYITTTSSPKDLWKEKIKNIGGEHYYLTQEEWEYMMDYFGFTGIPTYLFFDKNGVLKNKIIGYSGTGNMKKTIENLL